MIVECGASTWQLSASSVMRIMRVAIFCSQCSYTLFCVSSYSAILILFLSSFVLQSLDKGLRRSSTASFTSSNLQTGQQLSSRCTPYRPPHYIIVDSVYPKITRRCGGCEMKFALEPHQKLVCMDPTSRVAFIGGQCAHFARR
ncbi:hypothetical protein T4D_5713 [Trichinella pseudospiralis]|uniref:Uncharacterized protein n=1 Tax=Trichinella pseudospiralis TaxID=6337 RepID=A0A0V1G4I6_TRIPS|nr:hypothetical protein T4D_5713 [Trichinella pseudospiralis]